MNRVSFFQFNYKDVHITRSDSLIVVSAYRAPKITQDHVKVVLDLEEQKAYYTGDQGSFIFGYHVKDIVGYFDKPEPDYSTWKDAISSNHAEPWTNWTQYYYYACDILHWVCHVVLKETPQKKSPAKFPGL